MAVDVLEHDDGIVHESPNRQGQTSEGHDIDRMPRKVEQDEGTRDRNRDGQRNDQHRAKAAKKHQNHQTCQPSAKQHFMLYGGDGLADIAGLVEDQFQF